MQQIKKATVVCSAIYPSSFTFAILYYKKDPTKEFFLPKVNKLLALNFIFYVFSCFCNDKKVAKVICIVIHKMLNIIC